jgi:mannosyl-3-phosphoglycerate phosphatase
MVVFTDLDGTLLDAATYSFDAAAEALAALRGRGIPLVIVSSKTRAEIEPIQRRLGIADPFVVENGGAVFIQGECFAGLVPRAVGRDGYRVVELGLPYGELRRALGELAAASGVTVRGFGDMALEEIADRTGLPAAEAALARRREYDEPFVFEGPPDRREAFLRHVEARGLRCTRGGRFHHLTGRHDKGEACRLLTDGYRRAAAGAGLVTIGLGDSLNDRPMLEAVNIPLLVQRPDGSYDPELRLPHLRYAQGVGPAGWNQAVLTLLRGT